MNSIEIDVKKIIIDGITHFYYCKYYTQKKILNKEVGRANKGDQ